MSTIKPSEVFTGGTVRLKSRGEKADEPHDGGVGWEGSLVSIDVLRGSVFDGVDVAKLAKAAASA